MQINQGFFGLVQKS